MIPGLSQGDAITLQKGVHAMHSIAVAALNYAAPKKKIFHIGTGK